jgi:predicted nucleotidyltransferase
MTVYSLDLADKQELAFLAELRADVRTAAPDSRFLLVGAVARDLLLYHAHGIRATRATSDVDLALAVADWAEFGALRSALISSGAFSPHPKVAHKVFHRGRLEIDLIPFGGVERADGTIVWPPEDDFVMGVLGFREALASSIDVLLLGGQRVSVVALPMLSVLKIFAWSERRAREPRKDAPDLLFILRMAMSCSTTTATCWKKLGAEKGMLGLIFSKAQNKFQDLEAALEQFRLIATDLTGQNGG